MRKQTLAVAIAGIMAASSTVAQAIEFELLDGEMVIRVSPSISVGHMWRVENRKNSGDEFADGSNANDGNSNFDTGLVSQVFKINNEVRVEYKNYGALIRAVAFYDSVIMDDDISATGRRNSDIFRNNSIRGGNYGFTDATKDEAGSDARLMDAYIYGDFEYTDEKYMQLRLGRQVMSWGESLFLRNGISTANNPIYVSAARQPAVELKDLFIPLNTLALSMDLTDSLSMEAYYQFEWEENHLDAHGTYFSTTDNFGEGAERAIANLGSAVQPFVDAGLLPSTHVDAAIRIEDVDPEDEEQYGIALRYYAEDIDTEFGFYHINSHATTPAIKATPGEEFTCLNLITQAPGQYAIDQTADPSISLLCSTGLNMISAGTLSGDPAMAAAGFGNAVFANALGYMATSPYKATFPEDIKLWGFTFSTTIGDTSLSGEIAYRENDIVFTDYEDNALAAHTVGSVIKAVSASGVEALGLPMDLGIGNGSLFLSGAPLLNGAPLGFDPRSAEAQACTAQGLGSTNFGPITGTRCSGQETDLFTRSETYNASIVAIHNFGASSFSDGTTAVFEIGASYLPDVVDFQSAIGNRQTTTSVFTDYVDFANNVLGSPEAAAVYSSLEAQGDGTQDEDYLDDLSWGYRAVFAFTYNDVFAGVNLTPTIRWSHDVDGNSVRGGNFLEGRKSLSIGVNAIYQLNWEISLGYTAFMGADERNSLVDRDNVTFNVKYGF